MSAEKMTDEKRKILGQLRMTEALYVLMSDFTRMPFVECSEENYDDEVFVYFQEEDAKKEAERRCEKNEKVHVVKIASKFLLPFYTSLFPMGVNCICIGKGTGKEQEVQLHELITRNREEAEKQGIPLIENPELHLTALYFIQKLRALGEPKMTEELKELNEEMMAHYMRGRYILGVTEKNAVPILKQKDGRVLQPIFTDMQEFMKFQNVNRNEKMKTAVVEAAKLPELITKEAIGVTVNPFGVNLVLQLPGRANQTTKKPAPAYKERFAPCTPTLRKTEIQTGDHIAYEIRRKASSDSRKNRRFRSVSGKRDRAGIASEEAGSVRDRSRRSDRSLFIQRFLRPDHRDNAGTETDVGETGGAGSRRYEPDGGVSGLGAGKRPVSAVPTADSKSKERRPLPLYPLHR